MALFIGHIVITGVALNLGFKMEDCIGPDSLLVQWIRSLNVEDLEAGHIPMIAMFECLSITNNTDI